MAIQGSTGCAGRVILVVEGDSALRGVVTSVLEANGCIVHPAAGGDGAIRIAERVETVDLLLADAVMPEYTGKELAQRLCSLHPSMKVLFTSAFDEDKAEEQGILYPRSDFLRKPYTPDVLITKVCAALDGDISGTAAPG